jgi:hypothetical protein
LITERKFGFTPDGDVFHKARNATSSWIKCRPWQPAFFEPRLQSADERYRRAHGNKLLQQRPAAHDVQELVDFSIKQSGRALAVGALNVLTGNFICVAGGIDFFGGGGNQPTPAFSIRRHRPLPARDAVTGVFGVNVKGLPLSKQTWASAGRLF